MTQENNEKKTDEGNGGEAIDPPSEPYVDDRQPGAGTDTGHDEHEGIPARQGAQRPEPEPFVYEKFRKTELYDKPPTPLRGDRVVRRNSVRYLAGQVDSIHDRLALMEFRLERAVARLDRRIEELADRRR